VEKVDRAAGEPHRGHEPHSKRDACRPVERLAAFASPPRLCRRRGEGVLSGEDQALRLAGGHLSVGALGERRDRADRPLRCRELDEPLLGTPGRADGGRGETGAELDEQGDPPERPGLEAGSGVDPGEDEVVGDEHVFDRAVVASRRAHASHRPRVVDAHAIHGHDSRDELGTAIGERRLAATLHPGADHEPGGVPAPAGEHRGAAEPEAALDGHRLPGCRVERP
jgi:hypothetical protein